MDNYGNDKKLDTFLLFIMVSLIAIGIVTLYALQPHLGGNVSNTNFYLQQMTWFVIGGVGIATIMLLDFDFYRKLAWPLYFLGIGMLIGLFIWTEPLNGSYSWYQLPIGSLQPSEFMKVFLVITLAHVTTSHNEQWTEKNFAYDFTLFGKILGLTLIPMVLIAIQPDLGSALVIVSIAGFLTIVSGIRWRFIISLATIVIAISGILIILYVLFNEQFINFWTGTPFEHAIYRIQAWLNPHLYEDGSAMQSIQSMLAIGSGELFGKGFGNFEQSVFERHSDMIFTAVAEQFGFIGSSVVIILYFLLIYRIIQIALDCRDPFGTYIAVGFVGMFFYQIFQNIGMSIQLLPLTGLPLPFLSYGGTSLVVYMAAVGIVLNIHSRKKDYMFETE